MTIQIVEIIRRSEQGVTHPFICRGSDDQIYFVKGRGAGRHSLISEYLCGKLALSFGLPIADFVVVDVPDILIKASLAADTQELGSGLAFGSRSLAHVQEIQFHQLKLVDIQICKDVLMFDWWVRNSDRTLSEKGGNPNLLWDQTDRQLVVIDHNTAFEEKFDRKRFASNHIFADLLPQIFGDLVERELYTQRFQKSFAEFERACGTVPEEWWWVDDGVPAQFDKDAIKSSLTDFNKDFFWSIP